MNDRSGARISAGTAEMFAIEPGDQLMQELFGSGTIDVVQRQGELTAKTLRHSEMSACLFVGVGKEQFDLDFGLSQVLRLSEP